MSNYHFKVFIQRHFRQVKKKQFQKLTEVVNVIVENSGHSLHGLTDVNER